MSISSGYENFVEEGRLLQRTKEEWLRGVASIERLGIFRIGHSENAIFETDGGRKSPSFDELFEVMARRVRVCIWRIWLNFMGGKPRCHS